MIFVNKICGIIKHAPPVISLGLRIF